MENAVPMGGGTMRVASTWSFSEDGRATFATESGLEHDGRVVNQNSADYAGVWRLEEDRLVVELQGHSDSPFQLRLTESGELKSRKHGLWRRLPTG